MGRPKRLTIPGFYHIVNRGVEKRDIYLEDDDYKFFLDLLLKISQDFFIVIHVFCLMNNHYHLLIETKEENISKALQFLNDRYAKYFNKKYKRSGHLWQGRFKSFYLFDEEHFWIVAKYIERNPIKAKMLINISEYKYQSFFQWKNKTSNLKLLKDTKIFDMTLLEYEDYLATDLQREELDAVYTSPKIITDKDDFKVLIKRLEAFFEADRDIDRNANIKKAFLYGYTKAEIARFLHVSSTAVAKILG